MPIELIIGPPNSGRAGAIVSRYRAALDDDPVLVVPTADDVTGFERELCSGGDASLGGSITTFNGLIAEIARTVGASSLPPLTASQREALMRAAITRTELRRLHRSAARPGFAPALEALITELQAALITPAEFAREVAELSDPGHELELAALYQAYADLREASGHGDAGTLTESALAALRERPREWSGRPVFIYGFDDLSRSQLELVAALGAAARVIVAVTYADSRALSVRAGLVGVLNEELGARTVLELPFEDDYTSSATLRHLGRYLFEPGAPRVEPDDNLVLLQSAGARGEAEAIGIEIARLISEGFEPEEITIVTRHPASSGVLLASVLRELEVPVALEASAPLSQTCVGGSVIALCRAALDEHEVGALLAHLRSDTSLAPGAVDAVERRVRRGEAATVAAATEHWEKPPRHLARLLGATDAPARLRALARSARELAEGAHRGQAPLASRSADEGRSASGGIPFLALELRAGVAAAEMLSELASVGTLPGCRQPDLADAIDAIESASVVHWRGPASGRVRILSPYRVRAARARALFCAGLGDGEFPSAAPVDPLLSEERRRELGNPDLRRSEPADEERYLFHSCVSRPRERLYLSWQSCDEDGAALARSPFVDEVLDLIAPDPRRAEQLLTRTRGPERAVFAVDEATSERGLARALALAGWDLDREAALTELGVAPAAARATEALFSGVPDPRSLPGPLQNPRVLAELDSRRVFSANSLEGWVTCPYKWFVDHELSPQRLEPEADPLWIGSVVHRALELLYRDPPGDDSIPRRGDLDRWLERFRVLLDDAADVDLHPTRRAALDRARIQVEAFLRTEAEAEIEFRPQADLLELSFGPFDDEDDEGLGPLVLGEVSLRGRIDRVDVDSAGRSAIVRDYKTGKSVATADKFATEGTLQVPLYLSAVREVVGLDPVAGLYQPLGAVDKRQPRGVYLADDERLRGLGLARNDGRGADDFEQVLEQAKETATRAAAEMRRGRIGRRPLNGACPKYCGFQAICRLERVVGAVGDDNGGGESG